MVDICLESKWLSWPIKHNRDGDTMMVKYLEALRAQLNVCER